MIDRPSNRSNQRVSLGGSIPSQVRALHWFRSAANKDLFALFDKSSCHQTALILFQLNMNLVNSSSPSRVSMAHLGCMWWIQRIPEADEYQTKELRRSVIFLYLSKSGQTFFAFSAFILPNRALLKWSISAIFSSVPQPTLGNRVLWNLFRSPVEGIV